MKEKQEVNLDKTKFTKVKEETIGLTTEKTFKYEGDEKPIYFEVATTESRIVETSIVDYAEELSTGEKRYFGELPDSENDIDVKKCTECKKDITLNKLYNGMCPDCFVEKAPKGFVNEIKQLGVNEYLSKKAQTVFDEAKKEGKTLEEAMKEATEAVNDIDPEGDAATLDAEEEELDLSTLPNTSFKDIDGETIEWICPKCNTKQQTQKPDVGYGAFQKDGKEIIQECCPDCDEEVYLVK
jgi:rubredoxin